VLTPTATAAAARRRTPVAQPRPAESAATKTLRRNRDFTKLWIGEAVSTLGSRSSYVAYPLLVLALTGSAAQAGLVGFARQLPLFLFQLPAGALADRWNRRRLMIACDAGRAAAMAGLATSLLLGKPSLALIFVVAFVEGTLNVAFRPAEIGALKQIVPAHELPTAVAANEARDNAAYLGGPSLGGFLFAISRAAPFLADAASYLASLTCVAMIRRPLEEAPPSAERRSLRRDVGEGLSWLWRQPFLRASLLLAGGTNLISNALALFVILVARERGASSSAIGVMLTLVAAGGLAGAVATPLALRRGDPDVCVRARSPAARRRLRRDGLPRPGLERDRHGLRDRDHARRAPGATREHGLAPLRLGRRGCATLGGPSPRGARDVGGGRRLRGARLRDSDRRNSEPGASRLPQPAAYGCSGCDASVNSRNSPVTR
jgi:MFS family permease